MIIERFPEIQRLPLDEIAQLHAELGEMLFAPEEDAARDAAILELLEQRHAEYLNNPDLARPAEEVLARLRKGLVERFGERLGE
ncbi:MAG TPA: hypothetical protein VF593_08185 [Chthoniobacteraceae bacterium]|jgi:hypothetical protein